MNCVRPLIMLAAGLLMAAGAQQWRGWDKYQVILWSTISQSVPLYRLERLYMAGFTAEQCQAGSDCRIFSGSGAGFYVDNLVPELGFHHGRTALYEADRKGYIATGDKRFLVRKPCLDDPAFWAAITPRVQDAVRRHSVIRPLLYNLRDEPSVGMFTSPMDYCFCPHTLRAFRIWLQKQYGTVDGLNREWETAFKGWDEVSPATTFEIKRREAAALAAGARENYASWADHRAFMEFSFAQALARLRSIIREVDPATPVGIAGVQVASTWGGYDLRRISRAVDWLEPYDIGNTRAIVGSFMPAAAPLLATYFAGSPVAIGRQAWVSLLNGDRGAIVWEDRKDSLVEKPAGGQPRLTDRGTQMRTLFTEIRTAAARMAPWTRVKDRIAIHYSQASIRAHWMFDSREDGDSWTKRLASYELENSRVIKSRDGVVKILDDLGFTADFVAYDEIENGDLIRRGYRALILPQSVAMSAAECRQVEAFVRAGGIAIADNMLATMNEHCRRLPAGQLDALFGIKQNLAWDAEAGKPAALSSLLWPGALIAYDPALTLTREARRSTVADAPMVVEKRTAAGRTYYLNLSLQRYTEQRAQWAGGAALRSVFEHVLKAAGIEPRVRYRAAVPVLVRRFQTPAVEYVAIVQNPHVAKQAEFGRTLPVSISLPAAVRVREGGRDLGIVRDFSVNLPAATPVWIELRR